MVELVHDVAGPGLVEVPPGESDLESHPDLLGAARRDPPEVFPISALSPVAFAEVECNRGSRGGDLRGQLAVVLTDEANERTKLPNDVKRQVREHRTA